MNFSARKASNFYQGNKNTYIINNYSGTSSFRYNEKVPKYATLCQTKFL